MLLPVELDLTVPLSLLLLELEEFELWRVVVVLLLPEELCDLTVVPLLLLLERSGVTVVFLVPDELLLVVLSDDLTVASRFVVDVLPELVPSLTLVLLLLLLTVPLPEVLLSELLPLFASGRYTVTALPLTLVALPERLSLLSSLRTVVVLPVSRSYSLALGPL